mmetsp:Transcript_50654/g.109385  ORF Transcript_50654/g.109385 Transcript_50654/m.109385 type:complete len:235 (-) Transcript_50654:110-814(-)
MCFIFLGDLLPFTSRWGGDRFVGSGPACCFPSSALPCVPVTGGELPFVDALLADSSKEFMKAAPGETRWYSSRALWARLVVEVGVEVRLGTTAAAAAALVVVALALPNLATGGNAPAAVGFVLSPVSVGPTELAADRIETSSKSRCGWKSWRLRVPLAPGPEASPPPRSLFAGDLGLALVPPKEEIEEGEPSAVPPRGLLRPGLPDVPPLRRRLRPKASSTPPGGAEAEARADG